MVLPALSYDAKLAILPTSWNVLSSSKRPIRSRHVRLPRRSVSTAIKFFALAGESGNRLALYPLESAPIVLGLLAHFPGVIGTCWWWTLQPCHL